MPNMSDLEREIGDATRDPQSGDQNKCAKWRTNTKFLLFTLCLAGIVQGMIFTNVVISSIEKRFGWDSTQSGVIAGSYDIGSLVGVVPITYFGGRPGASKPRYIAAGMFIIGTGSLIFASPHFLTERYVDSEAFGAVSNLVNDSLEMDKVLDLCSVEKNPAKNSIQDEDCHSPANAGELPPSLQDYKYIFIFGQLLHGVGAAALITLGTTLLDESVQEKMAPVFIGIFESSFVLGPALGYVAGGRLLYIFTEFYVTDKNLDGLSPTSPQWIGAWWLGFLLILILSYVCAFLISMFHAKMRRKTDDKPAANPVMNEKPKNINDTTANDNEVDNADNANAEEDVLAMTSKLDYGALRDIPHALLKLITNPTYMCVSLGATCDAFLLAGMAAFLPKYLESQFGLTPGQAAMLVGAIVVPAGAGGTLMGGFSLKKFNLKRAGAIKMYIVCQMIILPLYFGFLLHCPTPPIAGITAPYSKQEAGVEGISFETTCNAGCNCPAPHGRGQEGFVCGLPSGLTYLSSCHAGCTSAVNSTGSQLLFTGCSCLASGPAEQIATPGMCPRDCNHLYLAVLIFFQVLFTFIATMPGLVAGLRSVEHDLRSLALGLQTVLVRGFGTIPGPIMFGFIIDRTCILWSESSSSIMSGEKTCETEAADNGHGNCRVYDNSTMSLYVLTVVLAWRSAALLFFIVAHFTSKKLENKHDEQQNKS